MKLQTNCAFCSSFMKETNRTARGNKRLGNPTADVIIIYDGVCQSCSYKMDKKKGEHSQADGIEIGLYKKVA